MYENNPAAKDLIAYLKLRIICTALNEGWIPQFTKDEYRYYPWFYFYTQEEYNKMDEENKGYCIFHSDKYCKFINVCAYYDFSSSYTNYSSIIAFRTSALAEYAGKQFIKDWVDFLF